MSELDQEQAAPDVSPLDMSDADIMNMDLTDEGFTSTESEEEASSETTEEDAPETDPEAPVDEDVFAETDAKEAAEDAEDDAKEAEEETDEEVSEADSDYKAQIDKILAPFKANGKEIKVESVDDAITLMKMGANYNKKMAALKPNLKLMRMLENQELLDEGKLNYLIDLSKKKPEAISKLIKESGLDPLDLNTDDAENYQPQSYKVDEREMAIDEVLETIKDTPTYNSTIDLVSTKWDAESRQTVIDNPEIIRVINDHKQNGIYDQISSTMEREKMLGKLEGLSDIEAYKQIGDRLYAEGKFGGTTQTPQANETIKPTTVKKPASNPQLTNRKKAASTTKASPAKATPTFNPLAMSDDEFEKIAASKYL